MNTESGSRKPDSVTTQSDGKDIVQEERERIENHQNEEKQKEIKKGNEIIQERVNTEESGSTKPDSTQNDEDLDQEDRGRTKKLERERIEKHLQNEEKQIEIKNAIVSEQERIRSKQIHDQNVLAKQDSTNEIPGTFHFIINNL